MFIIKKHRKISTMDASSTSHHQQQQKHCVKALLILDQEGKRVLAKYMDADEDDDQFVAAADEESKTEFERNLFERTATTTTSQGEAVNTFRLEEEDGLLCVHRSKLGMHFYVVGGAVHQKAEEEEEEMEEDDEDQQDDEERGQEKKKDEEETQEKLLRQCLAYMVHQATEPLAVAPQLGLSLLSQFRDQQQHRKRKRNAKSGTASLEELDRRASKGRRIRYVEIPRLVNFFPAAPERTPWSHERRNELFKSLFAK